MENNRPTDAELNAKLQEQTQKAKTRSLMIGLGTAVAVVGYLINGGFGIFLMIVGVVTLGLGFGGNLLAKDQVKDQVATPIIEAALNQVFTQVDFRPREHIADHVIRSTDMGFPFSYDHISGSDRILATYRGVRLELSDIRLYSITTTTDEDGNTQEEETTDFQGQWLTCDFGKQLSGDLRLSERGLLGRLFKGGIQTENETFNKRFAIVTNSPHDAFYILTPHTMEHLLELDNRAKGNTYMRFLREGKLHVALQTGKDLFQVRKVKDVDVATLRQQFVGEIAFVTGLLDALLQNETLFLQRPEVGQ